LGWEPKHNLQRTIERTVEWYLQNRWWWEPVRAGQFQEYYREQYGQRLAEATPYSQGTATT
jgi:dTDP-glucose 4,6-dehydratase